MATLRKRLHAGRTDMWSSFSRWYAAISSFMRFPVTRRALQAFRREVLRLWFRTLLRRSQHSRLTWEKFSERLAILLRHVQILQPYPDLRFDAKHPNIRGKEPCASAAPAWVCAGGSERAASTATLSGPP